MKGCSTWSWVSSPGHGINLPLDCVQHFFFSDERLLNLVLSLIPAQWDKFTSVNIFQFFIIYVNIHFIVKFLAKDTKAKGQLHMHQGQLQEWCNTGTLAPGAIVGVVHHWWIFTSGNYRDCATLVHMHHGCNYRVGAGRSTEHAQRHGPWHHNRQCRSHG